MNEATSPPPKANETAFGFFESRISVLSAASAISTHAPFCPFERLLFLHDPWGSSGVIPHPFHSPSQVRPQPIHEADRVGRAERELLGLLEHLPVAGDLPRVIEIFGDEVALDEDHVLVRLRR